MLAGLFKKLALAGLQKHHSRRALLILLSHRNTAATSYAGMPLVHVMLQSTALVTAPPALLMPKQSMGLPAKSELGGVRLIIGWTTQAQRVNCCTLHSV